MKHIFIIIVAIVCNSYSILNSCSDYDYGFPNNSDYIDCYRIMEDLMNDPDLILTICDDSNKCTDFIKRKLERGVYRIRYKMILGKHARCNSSFQEEIFIPSGSEFYSLLKVDLETTEGKVVIFHFRMEEDTWKFNGLELSLPR